MKKTMFWEGLSSLLFEASKDWKESAERHKKAEQALYNHKDGDNIAKLATSLVDAKKDLDVKTQRLYELVLVQRTVRELEEKGVEL